MLPGLSQFPCWHLLLLRKHFTHRLNHYRHHRLQVEWNPQFTCGHPDEFFCASLFRSGMLCAFTVRVRLCNLPPWQHSNGTSTSSRCSYPVVSPVSLSPSTLLKDGQSLCPMPSHPKQTIELPLPLHVLRFAWPFFLLVAFPIVATIIIFWLIILLPIPFRAFFGLSFFPCLPLPFFQSVELPGTSASRIGALPS